VARAIAGGLAGAGASAPGERLDVGLAVAVAATGTSGRGKDSDAGLAVTVAAAAASSSSRTPHAPQYFAASRLGESQSGHFRPEGAPHESQKRLPVGFS